MGVGLFYGFRWARNTRNTIGTSFQDLAVGRRARVRRETEVIIGSPGRHA